MMTWDTVYLRRMDYRTLLIVFILMAISLVIISATDPLERQQTFFTPLVQNQMNGFLIGWVAYFFFVCLDYHKLRQFTWVLYIIMIFSLLGLFFSPTIQNVQRWYKIPFIHVAIQPSEYAKLVVVLALSWFIEFKLQEITEWKTAWQGLLIVGIPFILILKQPDLGSAFVLFPITLIMFYFGGMHRRVVSAMTLLGFFALLFVLLMFLGIFSHEEIRPYATKFLKEYQYERLNPHSYHHEAAQIAIALGKWTGSGWRKSEFTGHHFLPTPNTDSIFPAYMEEFGMLGGLMVLILFFGLIYFSFQVTAVAKDHFGRVLSVGITSYLATHVVINVGMMCGLLPITGVPLVLLSYGRSSIVATMIALGILQSIYTRRFTFS